VLALLAFPDLRNRGEDWLLARLDARAGLDEALDSDPEAARRATAVDPRTLPPIQARMAVWLADTYKVAVEPTSALVAEAFRLGPRLKLEPSLILAVMAVESNLHPYIQSPSGAQGLMQVMPKVHRRRFEEQGGAVTAFDPLTNLRVGARVLQECVKLMGGSVQEGLRFYLGGSKSDPQSSAPYIAKVMGIKSQLDKAGEDSPARP
jgi:hypothetical protein